MNLTRLYQNLNETLCAYVENAKHEAWEKEEQRFADLIKLGTDERTPDGERDAACRAACNMIAVKTISGWSAMREKYLIDFFSSLKNIVSSAK